MNKEELKNAYHATFKKYISKDRISDILNTIIDKKIIFHGFLSNLNSEGVFKIYITSYKKLEK